MDRSQHLSPGEQFAHYRIIDKLGAGGMGEVYRARDEQLDREVAIKVLPAATFDDPAARGRLVREARAAAALNHPHICTVYEVGEWSGQAYIAMELVEGRTLSDRLTAGPLPRDEVVAYATQLADALAHAHDRGVVHRDLKSANVIVTPDGRVKVADFGLAKRLTATELSETVTQPEATFTLPGTVVGTLAYMAPEQLRGQIAQAPSDVWAFGVVLYEMAHGTPPFQGKTGFELSAAILNDAPPPLTSALPTALHVVIGRCLEKEPGRRYKTGGEVRAALVQTGSDPALIASHVRLARLTRRQALWLGVVAAAGVSGLATWRFWPANAGVRSLAVLPFGNAKSDPDFEYLCDGIAESLIKQIARLQSLRVSALSSVLNFKGPSVDPRAAGRQLQVETVLAGTLERDGGRLVISAQLFDVANGTELWANRYDRDASDLLNVRDEIASAIMDDGLRLRLTSDERRQLVRHPTSDGEAYDLYLQARFLQRRATEEDYLYSRELLERAVIRDRKFALAYGALSGTYAMMATDGLLRPTDAWPQVSRYLRQAVEIDPDLPEAHVFAHALAFLFDWDWAGAERERRLFLQSLPGDFDPHAMRALAVERWALGRPDEALQLARRTRELDPLSPYLATLEADYLLRAGQLDAAIALYENTIRLDPLNPNAYFGLAEAKALQGRYDEAIDARRRAHAAAGDDALKDLIAAARGEQGYRSIDQAWVRLQLLTLKEREKTSYVSPLDFARAYAQLDEKELAFKYLDASFVDRSPGLVFLKVDRAWDNIRNDARFAAAIQRVKLP
jgi:TolB-like protein